MSIFAQKAESFTGVVADIDGKSVVVEVDGEPLIFCVEGMVVEDLATGHDVTIVTWGNASAVRVVDHTSNTLYRPYYNPQPDHGDNLPEANRSPADVPEGRIGLTSLLPAVFLATIYQSIPVYGWYVTYKMMTDADKSVLGTAPHYASYGKRYFAFFVVLAVGLSGFFFLTSGAVLKAALVYMTVLYIGTFVLMRLIFQGIEEIDRYTRQKMPEV